ncbi:2285_t:CDS:2 [Funneliformis caledonium]|uniref:2285_t:CDS:1 n=1 Tax=Funneliformis caledonium TaxID=1117310 RepID=A0A9N9ENE7_9GLOM|nr:2285_t:CDS:2 [Funneliformis caledonium]
MVDWLDENFSDQSDSSDEEFVLQEDAVKDTSDSSEEESGSDEDEVDRSTTANQKSPPHHTNGNSAVDCNGPRNTSPSLINGNSLDVNTNGRIGAIRHRQEHSHSHLYRPYELRTNGDRIDNDELNGCEIGSFDYRVRSGALLTTQDRPLRELKVPFEIFSENFNRYHEEQESTLKELKSTEQKFLQMNTVLEEEVDKLRDETDGLKSEYKEISEENRKIREQIEEMHALFIPYFNNLLTGNEEDDDEEDLENMHLDKIIVSDEIGEKKENEGELNDVNIGPFIIDMARRFAPQQQ